MNDQRLKIISAKEAVPQKRKSPASMIMENLPDGYKSVKFMADRYGVHVQTIRRLIHAVDKHGNPKINAPSSAVQQGGLLIYLFTDEDVAEVDAYMAKKGYIVKLSEDE